MLGLVRGFKEEVISKDVNVLSLCFLNYVHYVANTCISPYWKVALYLNRFKFPLCMLYIKSGWNLSRQDCLSTWFSIIHECHFPWDVVPKKIGLNSYKPVALFTKILTIFRKILT